MIARRFPHGADGYPVGVARSREQERLARVNDEIRALVARYPQRSASELVRGAEAVLTRAGLPEPSREGLIQWIDQAIAEARAR